MTQDGGVEPEVLVRCQRQHDHPQGGKRHVDLSYDKESRLKEVRQNGSLIATFTYDADGRLVKRWAGQTTVYIGDLYQKNLSTGQETKYYYLGNRRVAVRIGNTPYWLLVDHLGSTMVVLDSSGSKVGEKWYYPFGEERYSSGSLFVERRFTGQRWDDTIELYDYRARYYDPVLGRFVQADTIVPEPGNPQALNRYSYVYNNPVRYTDPSGRAICADEDCSVVFGPRQRNLIRRGPGAYYWDQNGLEMVWDWFTESGPQTRYYGASAAMTRDLMGDEGVQQAREQFYLTGEAEYRYRFTNPKQPIREAFQWVTGKDRTGVGSVLGSYAVYIQDNGDGTATIWVENVVSRESATRLLGYAPSVEDTIASGQIVANTKALAEEVTKFVSGKSTLERVRKKWPRSVLDSTTRGQPSSTGLVPGVWGGNMKLWFMWTEPLCVTCK